MSDGDAVDQTLEAEQHIQLYCQAIASLPEKCRAAFLLRKVHGLSHKEIADIMSLSLSSVEKYLKRALIACDDYMVRQERTSLNSSFKSAAPNPRLHTKS